ncbi:MAG: InlB B-repeat-containing protein [Tannerella sp.]|jgi:hypothetical protein|nr:InlB B-repeat-containing protein [Tannerella sp.]
MLQLNYFRKRFWYLAALLVMLAFCGGSLHATDYVLSNNGVNVVIGKGSGNHTISGSTINSRVIVQSGYVGKITLRGMSINIGGSYSPFLVEGENGRSNANPVTNVDIELEGNNIIQYTGSPAAALQVNQGAQINISSLENDPLNTLKAYATTVAPGQSIAVEAAGAGIGAPNSPEPQGWATIYNKGGGINSTYTNASTSARYPSAHRNTAGGNIIIKSGTVDARGAHGAGIGGGFKTWYDGIIIVTGGKVQSRSVRHAAGIGSGCPLGGGVEDAYAEGSAIVVLPPAEIEASGSYASDIRPDLALAGAKYTTYVNDPANPLLTIRAEDYEKNANIYLDLTETEGLQDVFNKVYSTFNLTHVWIGKTGASDGLMKVHGLFKNPTTFFTDASSSAPTTLGRPYMPVNKTTSGAETIILPLFKADISFTDYPSMPLVEGYSTAEAEKSAFCIKIEYQDNLDLSQLTYELQKVKDGGTSDFKNLIFLDSDSTTKMSAPPTTLSKGDKFYIVAPLKDGKIIGGYEDVILIKGKYDNEVMAGYLRRISAQVVVRDDTDKNDHIKVTANPQSFTEIFQTDKTVKLTLNINHMGLKPNYDPITVKAKYLITTEPNYEAALTATPLTQWANMDVPLTEGTGKETTVSFKDKATGTYYIHWYVVSGYFMAHSKDVTDPVRQYGGFGPYNIVVGKEVTYDGNGNTSGTAPIDPLKYASGATVTTKLHGDLARTGGTDPIVFAGWAPTKITAVLTKTTAADTTTAFVREGNTFVITSDTTMYAVWSTDTNGNDIPDIFEDGYGVTYDGNGHTSGTAPVDPVKYVSGASVTTKLHGDLARTGGTDPIVFAGWTPTQVTNVLTKTTAADTTTAFVREGNTFVITGNTTMYAVWSTDANGNDIPDIFEDGYSVTYDGNGNTSGTAPVDPLKYVSGASVTTKLHGDLTRTGGTDPIVFAGWTPTPVTAVLTKTTAADTTTAFVREGNTFVITGNTTMYAVWSTDTNGNDVPDIFEDGYSVTYDGNGNTSGTIPVDPLKYVSGASVTTQFHGDLARTGTPAILFAGWAPTQVSNVLTPATASDTTTAFVREGNTFVITGNTTMYAVWSTDTNGNDIPDIFEDGYKVTYHANGASGTPPVDATTYLTRTSVTVKANSSLTKTGALFIGWSFSASPLVVVLADVPNDLTQPNATFTITANTTLYAVWAADVNGPDNEGDDVPDYLQYGVTYDGNGETSGSVADNCIYNNGMNVTLKDKGTLVKTQRVFLGWNPAVQADLMTIGEYNSFIGLNTMKKADETFVIAGNTIWYAVWAKDENGNGIPDYLEIEITYEQNLMDGPALKETVERGSTVTFTDKGLNRPGYVIIGWTTKPFPMLISNAIMETMATATGTFGTFYAVGSSYTVTASVTLYAVWAIDKNNDGYPDYGSTIVLPASGGVNTRGLLLSGDATGNGVITGARVWAHGSTLYIESDKAVRAKIYTIGGMLYKQVDVPEGMVSEPLPGGIYIVEMDGVRYKAVVK